MSECKTGKNMNAKLIISNIKGNTQCWSRSWIWWKYVFLGPSRWSKTKSIINFLQIALEARKGQLQSAISVRPDKFFPLKTVFSYENSQFFFILWCINMNRTLPVNCKIRNTFIREIFNIKRISHIYRVPDKSPKSTLNTWFLENTGISERTFFRVHSTLISVSKNYKIKEIKFFTSLTFTNNVQYL